MDADAGETGALGGPAYDTSVRAVPPALVERAARLDAGEFTPVRPRHASTVVLLRDGSAGLEVYLLRRHTSMAFAAGMYAFPGGSADARDADAAVGWAGPAPAEWAARLGFADERLARASVCAAVRETFEEAGVLLAGPDTGTVVADPTGDDWERDRMALLGRVLPFAELLERRGLVLRSDLLAAWDHWITPRVEERRFDTRFFVAALPAGQQPRDVSGEADRVAWMRPADALASVHRGEMRMLPPTYLTLASLTDLPDVEAALAAAGERTIRPVQPRVRRTPDGGRWVLPWDADWDSRVTGDAAPADSSAYDEGELR
ncbi:NUDIX hydrolase [Actinopolymorpha singaporensis]|uniref:Nudix hydrolase domain-containing protein n=1 Tax=Actinopolymorpha singaporensis TaxID=117157 RepID=A0A1H1PZF8_9ACTN|nr:NUDIX hydrolase [Actinopolymorpha singaporensis]SDS16602.1 hypothetical protein SAMN04489717_1825 [Actinopolymorpha singaporensis]